MEDFSSMNSSFCFDSFSQDVLKSCNELCEIISIYYNSPQNRVAKEWDSAWPLFDKNQINARNDNGQTLLCVACRYGCTNIVAKLLTAKKLQLNGIQDVMYGETPLHAATSSGSTEIIAMLLTCGVQPELGRSFESGKYPYEAIPEDFEKVNLLWQTYREKGVDAIKSFLPSGWTNPRSQDPSVKPSPRPSDVISRNKPQGFTLNELIDFVISPQNYEQHFMVNEFLLTYRSICTPQQLLGLIIDHCKHPDEQLHVRAYAFLRTWIDKHRYDFDKDKDLLLPMLKNFASELEHHKARRQMSFSEEKSHPYGGVLRNTISPSGPLVVNFSKRKDDEYTSNDESSTNDSNKNNVSKGNNNQQINTTDTTDITTTSTTTITSPCTSTSLSTPTLTITTSATTTPSSDSYVSTKKKVSATHSSRVLRLSTSRLEIPNVDDVTKESLHQRISSLIERIENPAFDKMQTAPDFYNNVPRVILPAFMNNPNHVPSIHEAVAQITLNELDPCELARQLTLIEEIIWKGVQLNECLGAGWMKTNKEILAPSICTYINWFNKICLWIETEIIIQDNIKDRARVITKFVETIVHLHKLNNINACQEIAAALTSGMIGRLKETFSYITKERPDVLTPLHKITNLQENNSQGLRALMQSIQPPCIPYLGLLLKDLVFLHDGNKDTLEDGTINWTKRRLYAAMILQIKSLQQDKYCLTKVPPIAIWLKDRIEKVWNLWAVEGSLDDKEKIIYSIVKQIEPKNQKNVEKKESIPKLEKLKHHLLQSTATTIIYSMNEYSKFKYLFYKEEQTTEQQTNILLGLQLTSLLNDAHREGKTMLEVQVHQNIVKFDLQNRVIEEFTNRTDSQKYKLIIVLRSSDWYWKDKDGVIKKYPTYLCIDFNELLSTGSSILNVLHGKRRYNIDLKRKHQLNIETKLERTIYSEQDVDEIMAWKDFPFDFSKIEHNSLCYISLSKDSQEYKKVSEMFYFSMPTFRKPLRSYVGLAQKLIPTNDIQSISRVVNPVLLSLWQVKLKDLKARPPPHKHHVKFLFYHQDKTYQATQGKWEFNTSHLHAFVFSENASYFAQQQVKKLILAQVIIAEEVYRPFENILQQDLDYHDCVIAYHQGTQSWCWCLTNIVNLYPSYLIEYH